MKQLLTNFNAALTPEKRSRFRYCRECIAGRNMYNKLVCLRHLRKFFYIPMPNTVIDGVSICGIVFSLLQQNETVISHYNNRLAKDDKIKGIGVLQKLCLERGTAFFGWSAHRYFAVAASFCCRIFFLFCQRAMGCGWYNAVPLLSVSPTACSIDLLSLAIFFVALFLSGCKRSVNFSMAVLIRESSFFNAFSFR